MKTITNYFIMIGVLIPVEQSGDCRLSNDSTLFDPYFGDVLLKE
ncbi:MAG TPA: hypothetical protein VK941_13745 [Gillisia sp.]|nr:hypothetical protein [Gillisia sp.]